MEGDRERLIVGCVTGEVLVVEALDLKVVLHTEGAAAADCIVPFSKGFLVGQSNGAVAVFERDDRDSYLRSKVCISTLPVTSQQLRFSSHSISGCSKYLQ